MYEVPFKKKFHLQFGPVPAFLKLRRDEEKMLVSFKSMLASQQSNNLIVEHTFICNHGSSELSIYNSRIKTCLSWLQLSFVCMPIWAYVCVIAQAAAQWGNLLTWQLRSLNSFHCGEGVRRGDILRKRGGQ